MDQTTLSPHQIARDYHEAWAHQDLDAAMSFVADDVICDAPPGRIEGAFAYRAFLEPFFDQLRRAELVASFADDESAVLMYEVTTSFVRNVAAVEYLSFEDNVINYVRMVYDRTAFKAVSAS